MPGLDAYTALAPFQIEELVDAANSILRDRPRLALSKRTVRYYVAQGVLPAPRGAPKFARYGMEHLARIVGARVLQDEGRSLEEASETLGQAFRKGEAVGVARVQSWLASGSLEDRETPTFQELATPPAASPRPRILLRGASVRETSAAPEYSRPPRSDASTDATIPVESLRYELTPLVILDVRKSDSIEGALEEALGALEQLLETIREKY